MANGLRLRLSNPRLHPNLDQESITIRIIRLHITTINITRLHITINITRLLQRRL